MEPYKAIGGRLREARERAGLTQEQAARAVGILREQLSYFENGVREIDIIRLEKLAGLYGFNLDFLIHGEPTGEADVFAVAFRAGGNGDEDLPAIVWSQRFAKNLSELNAMLDKKG